MPSVNWGKSATQASSSSGSGPSAANASKYFPSADHMIMNTIDTHTIPWFVHEMKQSTLKARGKFCQPLYASLSLSNFCYSVFLIITGKKN